MYYTWNSDLQTGHNLIDVQHESLFFAANRFADAFRNDKGERETEKTLRFLLHYTEQHFRDEEELQKRYAPKYYDRHRAYHQEFKKTVRVFVTCFETEGPTNMLLNEIYESVGSWLLHHIKSDDFVLAACIRKIR